MLDQLVVQPYLFLESNIVTPADGVEHRDNLSIVGYLEIQVMFGGRIGPADRNLDWPGVKTTMGEIQILKAATEQACRVVDTIRSITIFS